MPGGDAPKHLILELPHGANFKIKPSERFRRHSANYSQGHSSSFEVNLDRLDRGIRAREHGSEISGIGFSAGIASLHDPSVRRQRSCRHSRCLELFALLLLRACLVGRQHRYDGGSGASTRLF